MWLEVPTILRAARPAEHAQARCGECSWYRFDLLSIRGCANSAGRKSMFWALSARNAGLTFLHAWHCDKTLTRETLQQSYCYQFELCSHPLPRG
jgi:hypothetical protein